PGSSAESGLDLRDALAVDPEQVQRDFLTVAQLLAHKRGKGRRMDTGVVVHLELVRETLAQFISLLVLAASEGDGYNALDQRAVAVVLQPGQGERGLGLRDAGADGLVDLYFQAGGGPELRHADPVHEFGHLALRNVAELLTGLV